MVALGASGRKRCVWGGGAGALSSGGADGVWCVSQELSPVVTLVPDMMIPMAVSAIRRSIINQVPPLPFETLHLQFRAPSRLRAGGVLKTNTHISHWATNRPCCAGTIRRVRDHRGRGIRHGLRREKNAERDERDNTVDDD